MTDTLSMRANNRCEDEIATSSKGPKRRSGVKWGARDAWTQANEGGGGGVTMMPFQEKVHEKHTYIFAPMPKSREGGGVDGSTFRCVWGWDTV